MVVGIVVIELRERVLVVVMVVTERWLGGEREIYRIIFYYRSQNCLLCDLKIKFTFSF